MKKLSTLLILILGLAISSCGGTEEEKDPAVAKYSVQVTVSGLIGTGLVLQNNSGDDLSITSNTNFTFTEKIAKGSAYSVSVKTVPNTPIEKCVIANATGTIGDSNISLTVTCDLNWVQDAYVKADIHDSFDNFGQSVAISEAGDVMVIGAPAEDTDGIGGAKTNSGAVYIFRKDNSGDWSQEAFLKASNVTVSEQAKFGQSVAINEAGDIVVVGAHEEDSNANTITNDDDTASADASSADSGAAYIFKYAGSWTQDAYIKASNSDAGDYFGYNVAISGETVVVGAYEEDSNATGIENTNDTASADDSVGASGAVYVFKKDGSDDWYQEAYIKSSNSDQDDYFSWSIAIDSGLLVVGAKLEDSTATGIGGNEGDNTRSAAGAVYLFREDGSGDWSQEEYIKASNTNISIMGQFGHSVSVNNETIIVGAYGEDSDATGVTNDNNSNDGVNGDKDNSGAVYVFKKDTGTWYQDAYIKTSTIGENYNFGDTIAIKGDMIIASSTAEKSNAKGIENDDGTASSDVTLTASGAVYVFKKDRSGNWVQDAYIKASNTMSGDNFGKLALGNNTIVVGAPSEDSDATGVENDNNTPSVDNSGESNSGAAYIFQNKAN